MKAILPTQFESRRLGHVCEVQLGKMLQPDPERPSDVEVPYLRAGSLRSIDSVRDTLTMWASPAERSQYAVVAGDLVVSEGGDVGRTALVPELDDPHIIQNSLHRVRSFSGSVRFVGYVLDALKASGWIDVVANRSTLGHLTVEKLQNLVIPWPSPDEQARIAGALDDRLLDMDASIVTCEAMIVRLTARANAIARRAFSSRDGEASWSPGPYWHPPVPLEWMPCAIGWRRATGSGATPESGNPLYYWDEEDERGTRDGRYSWVTTAELRENRISSTVTTLSALSFRDYTSLRLYPSGTILMAMYGATVGRLAVLEKSCATNQACCAIADGDTLDQRFLYWWLWTFREEIVGMSYGSGQGNISQELVRRLRIPAPSLEAQAQIVEVVGSAVSEAEASIAVLRSQILELKGMRRTVVDGSVRGVISEER